MSNRVAQIQRNYKGRKRSIWDWFRRAITNFWDSRQLFGKYLKRIKRIFIFAFTFLPFYPKENVHTKRWHSVVFNLCFILSLFSNVTHNHPLPDHGLIKKPRAEEGEKNGSLNHERDETTYIEENIAKTSAVGILKTTKAKKVHATKQSTAIISCDIKKSAPVTHSGEMINKHSKDNLSDFIFDDNYFEDSWGLHSNLLLATYMHQSLRVAAACNINAEVSRQSTHMLKTVHLEGIESETGEKYCASEESNVLDQTDHNMNEFSFSNSLFENSCADVVD